jgi:hypothetical protein
MVIPPPPQKHLFVIWWLLNFSHASQTYSNHMESQCFVDTTNFIKIKNHFNHFLTIFAFFDTSWHIYFWHKYSLTSHHIRFKNVVSLEFDLFGFWPTIICKKTLWKSFIIMTWLKFKHGHGPLKTIECDNNFCTPPP